VGEQPIEENVAVQQMAVYRTGDDPELLEVPVGAPGRRGVVVDRAAYGQAAPWPHVVVDGVFDPALVRAAEIEQLAAARGLRTHTSRRQVKAERSLIEGEASRHLLDVIDGLEFRHFLEALTGVNGLQADPSHFWAGLHVSPPGAFQAVHRDFQKHPATGLFHRVNVLLYLSSAWEDQEGAHLELWSPDAQRCVARVTPEAGRVVIFESNARTLHAVSRQTSAVPGRLRLSLAAYFYSEEPPAGGIRRTGTLFQPRPPGRPPWESLIGLADALRGSGRRLTVLPRRLAGRCGTGAADS
jgi:Rps23 Pro-64 3,4-dihydroxylase Tpa1-like proline 4-hydroxylase